MAKKQSNSKHSWAMSNNIIRNNDDIFSGKRYVFFSSLLSEESESLRAYGYHAQNLMKEIDVALQSPQIMHLESEDIKDGTNYLQEYLALLQQMCETSAKNEKLFLDQKIQSIEDKKIKKRLEKEMQSAYDNGNFNYLQIIDIFNLVLQDSKKYKQYLSDQKHNLNIVKRNILKLSKKSQEAKRELENKYITDYTSYINDYNKKLRESINDKNRYLENLNTKITRKINKIIKALAKNPNFIFTIIQKCEEKDDKITEDEIKDIVINLIIDTVLFYDQKDEDELIKIILRDTKNLTSDQIDKFLLGESKNALNKSSKLYSLEEAALLTENSLAMYINGIDNAQIEELADTYGGEDRNKREQWKKKLIKLKNEFSETMGRTQQANLTRFLRTSIKNKASRDTGVNFKRLYSKKENGKWKRESMTSYKERLSKDIKGLRDNKFFDRNNLKNTLAGKIYITKLRAPSTSEILALDDTKKRIKEAIVLQLPGAIQLKSDVRFSVVFNQDNFIEGLNISEIIKNALKDNFSSFLTSYKKSANGETNIAVAEKEFIDNLKKIKEQIDNTINAQPFSTEEQKLSKKIEAYEELSKTFSASISVKQYDLYNNNLGFHGGSLGGDGTPEAVLKNINKMYELGGITPLDLELLIFAVINCGEATVNGTSYHDHIANYILGGAALAMFDEGFTVTENYLEKIKSELKSDFFSGPKTLHLYYLNNLYVPESFILTTIYNNLLQVYTMTESQIQDASKMINKSNSKVFITNTVTNEDIDTMEPISKKRWEKISEIAMTKKVHINYLFMSGLLDIIENLPKAFRM